MSVVVVSGLKYPDGDAGSIRQHAFAKALKDGSKNVFVIGYGAPTSGIETNEGVPYVSLRSPGEGFARKVANRLLFLRRLKNAISNISDLEGIIAMSGLLPKELKALKQFAGAQRIPFVFDSVEYYSPEEYSHACLNYQYRNNIWCNESFLADGHNVIAISRFLEKHFRERGVNVVRIPVIFDVLSMESRFSGLADSGKKTYVYAGLPGKKDYLATIVEGFSRLDSNIQEKCLLKLVGVTKAQLVDSCGVDARTVEELGDALVCTGRVSRDEAKAAVRSADYTLFLRPNLRYAQAGFPTKFVESLSCGTPVITNLSSDLQDYHKEGHTGIVVSECSSKALAEAIGRSQIIGQEKYCEMRRESRKVAERCFDYRRYISVISEFSSKMGGDDGGSQF